jgi:signal transduction histidine kinase
LLTLARLDPDESLAGSTVSLHSLLTEALADTTYLANERGLTVDLDSDGKAPINGSEDLLGILLCNLLINAFRYASEGSPVRIRLRTGERVELVISNHCPTLSAREFGRICERFYRAPGAAGQGAGLGLSIVARIAEQHGASMRVGPDESGQGFCVRLAFPPADIVT